MIKYNWEDFAETICQSNQLSGCLDDTQIVWMNIDGCQTTEMLQEIGRVLGLHELALEDVSNSHQRAKVDDYDDYMYIVMRMVDQSHFPNTEQLSIFLGKNYVLTIQEHEGGDCLEHVRERLRRRLGDIRKRGADYLVYAIIDAVVDGYFPVIESLGERIEELEDQILEAEQMKSGPARIHEIKRETTTIRRAVWPLRDAINILCRDTHPLITDHTRIYYRDCHDHAIRIIDLVETYRELSHDLMDIYLSTVNNRMNEIMKVLTIITSLFIPPTLIAGIYGMNFETNCSPWNMPELKWYLGYPLSLLLMVVLSCSLTYYLHRKGWLFPEKSSKV